MMRQSLAAAFAAFTLLGSLLVASPAEARREWQAFGGSGDATTKIECPAGQVMVGMQGHAGAWINQLRIICAPLTGDFSTGSAQGFGGYFGGRGGGAAAQIMCPGDTVPTQVSFLLSSDKTRVSTIDMACTRADGESVVRTFGLSNASTEDCPKALGILPKGCDPNRRVQTCAQEQIVGFTIRSGVDVNAIGVICDRRDAPRVAAAPPPPAAAPPRTYRASGRTGGSAPPAAFIAQPWSIVATPGTPFRLVFHEDQGPGAMWGEMLFADTKLNGTAIGTLSDDGKTFTFTYEQPKIGVSGRGSLKIYTSRIMGGSVTTDQDGQSIRWAGHF